MNKSNHLPSPRSWLRWFAVLALSLTSLSCYTHDGEHSGLRPTQGTRIIIGFHDEVVADDAAMLDTLARVGGVALHYVSRVGPRTHVYSSIDALDAAALAALLQRLDQSDLVEYAEADRRAQPAQP